MLKKWINRAFQSTYLKNVLTLSSGTTVAQLISMITAPVLYRIYSKEDYGTLGLYMAITGVVGVFSTFHYAETVLLERKESDAAKALVLIFLINLSVAIISIIPIWFFSLDLGKWLGNEKITFWLWLLPISLFTGGCNQALRIWLNREKEYRFLSINAVVTAICIPIVSIVIGLTHSGPMGLFMGLIIGNIISTLLLFLNAQNRVLKLVADVKSSELISIIRKYIEFPKYGLPAELLNKAVNQMPVFMLSSYVGPAVVGVYNLTTRMLGLPIQLISGAVSEVFKERVSFKYSEQGSSTEVFISTAKALTLLSIIPSLVVVFYGPELFAFVFGDQWYDAGRYAQVLILFYGIKLIASPLSYMYYVVKRQKEDLYITIYMLVSSYIIFYVFLNVSIILCLTLFSLNYSLIYLFVVYRSYIFSKGV